MNSRMQSPASPTLRRTIPRVVALLLTAVMAAGAGVAPAAAQSHLCVADLFGSDCAGEPRAVAANTPCCEQQPADMGQQPPAPADDAGEKCPCPCSQCCLPLGRAPVNVSTGNPVVLSMQPAFPPAVAPVLSRPVGVHTSVFHPPRA